MKIDVALDVAPREMTSAAVQAEAAGFAGGWTMETAHDAFLGALAAAGATRRLEVGTSVAIAFGRTPLTVAQTAWDLQAYSAGRFTLGLGSQIRPHIEKRYGMPWSAPAARMREFVLAVRAIWESWMTQGRLNFRGEHYRHTYMTPMFMPDPADLSGFGLPPILVAGVGPLMTAVAGEVADGFVVHPFTTERYFDEVTMPRLRFARESSGQAMDGFTILHPALIATGHTESDLAASIDSVRRRLGFYASTPAYRSVLELHGWGDVHESTSALIRAGDWAGLGEVITEEMVREFAIVGTPDELPTLLQARYAERASRVWLSPARPEDADAIHAFARSSSTLSPTGRG